eukprot:CAMPEP_0116568084 /NCGR_PEP_ID=MMETSP0397-20121206/15411_1 /TAXON_ID=216820 /ORGANISM="Cyclophora tenuis, Strain ECT3854" /LENGTH=50 /DNA_ID=CAMNT_0004095237 /DNA_START=409 /DNA_END=561 /DNA_ORIENTATION=-
MGHVVSVAQAGRVGRTQAAQNVVYEEETVRRGASPFQPHEVPDVEEEEGA